MDSQIFSDDLKAIVSKTSLFGSTDLEAVVIINPKAGGFSRKDRSSQVEADVERAKELASSLPDRKGHLAWRAFNTNGPKHAGKIATDLVEEAAMKPNTQWLIILASGDGTSLEFLDELSRAPEEFRSRFTVLRLPMGTGNDGSDGRELFDSLSRLIGKGRLDYQPALRVIPAKGGPASERAQNGEWRAFNIASIGLDAFVTNMTNKLKTAFPGDSYKLWVDLSAVFYDKLYPPRQLKLKAFDNGGKNTANLDGLYLLIAMGVSGRRTYGSNKLILPDEDNVCAVRQMPFLRKLALKGPMMSGQIRNYKEAQLFSAEYIEIDYHDRILVQMDGEAELLVAEDFPLRIEKTEPIIRHIARLQA